MTTTSQRFTVEEVQRGALHGYGICDRAVFSIESQLPVVRDLWATEKGAEYAVRLLNDGLALLDEHLPLGCRVIPIYSQATTLEMQ